MGRKLKKGEVIHISRILDNVNFKSYSEYLLSNKLEKILKSQEDKKTKIALVIGDIFSFILQNMHKAEENLDILAMSYTGKTKQEIEDMDGDDYIMVLKECFIAGIPKVISDYVDVGTLKKKLKEVKNLVNENSSSQ